MRWLLDADEGSVWVAVLDGVLKEVLEELLQQAAVAERCGRGCISSAAPGSGAFILGRWLALLTTVATLTRSGVRGSPSVARFSRSSICSASVGRLDDAIGHPLGSVRIAVDESGHELGPCHHGLQRRAEVVRHGCVELPQLRIGLHQVLVGHGQLRVRCLKPSVQRGKLYVGLQQLSLGGAQRGGLVATSS